MFQNNIIYQNVIMEAHIEVQKWINDTTKPTSELQYEGEPVTWSSPDNEDKKYKWAQPNNGLVKFKFYSYLKESDSRKYMFDCKRSKQKHFTLGNIIDWQCDDGCGGAFY